MSECKLMNQCLDDIAKDYPTVKVCKIKSIEINLSDKFVSYFSFCLNKIQSKLIFY